MIHYILMDTPHGRDDNCGSALLSVGKKTEAAQHVWTALDINPNFLTAREQWEQAAASR